MTTANTGRAAAGTLSAPSLALSLALSLSPALGAGCQRGAQDGEHRAHAAEPGPLGVPVRIAPVADTHPWAMAFLTSLATDPAGADVEAKLGRRSGRAGRPAADPILRASERGPLVDALARYEAAHPRPPELALVWLDEGESVRLLFVEDGAALELSYLDSANPADLADLADPADPAGGLTQLSLVDEGQGPRVRLSLAPAQREAFVTLSRRYLGDRLALVHGDAIVMLTPIHQGSTTASGVIELPPYPGGSTPKGVDDGGAGASAALFERLRRPPPSPAD